MHENMPFILRAARNFEFGLTAASSNRSFSSFCLLGTGRRRSGRTTSIWLVSVQIQSFWPPAV